MGFDPNTTKHVVGTQRLLALLEELPANAFLEAVEGGLCVFSQSTGEMVSVVRFLEEEVTVLHEEEP